MITKDKQLGKKKQSLSKVKKDCWKWCSLYVRTRDCIETCYSLDQGECFTCGKVYPIKQLQAGHFIPGRNNKVLFDVDQIRAQCLTKESSLLLSNGTYRPIDEVVVGDKLIGFDDGDFHKKECVVQDVSSFIPDELYEVELEDGSKFWATKDHLVVANGKFVGIGEILDNFSGTDILEYENLR